MLSRMPEVLVEYVDWRRADIGRTALQVISFYTHDLGQLGTSRWIDFASRVIPVVMGDTNSREVRLQGEAFELVFYPQRPILIPHIEDQTVIWQEKEPRLVFRDFTYMNLTPGYRNLIYHVNQAIAEEVSDTYKMKVLDNPLAFVFPRQEYGRTWVDRAVLI